MVCFADVFLIAVLAIMKVLVWYMTGTESRIKRKAICSNVNQAQCKTSLSFSKYVQLEQQQSPLLLVLIDCYHFLQPLQWERCNMLCVYVCAYYTGFFWHTFTCEHILPRRKNKYEWILILFLSSCMLTIWRNHLYRMCFIHPSKTVKQLSSAALRCKLLF